MSFHYSSLKTSPRLQRVLLYLRRHAKYGATTAMIATATGAMSVSTVISELRANGHPTACKFEGVTKDGRKIFRYTLEAA